MKKSLTLALALIALVVFTGLSLGQGAQQKDKQKGPGRNVVIEREKTVTGTVMEVNENAQTFKVKTDKGELLILSFSKMKGDFTREHFKVRDRVDVTYTDPPKPGDPPAATTVKSSKSNSSEVARAAVSGKGVTKIGNITVARTSHQGGAGSPPNPPVALPVVVTCNGGTTTITCPDGWTPECAAVVAEYCQ